jgi:hypothetical protein
MYLNRDEGLQKTRVTRSGPMSVRARTPVLAEWIRIALEIILFLQRAISRNPCVNVVYRARRRLFE